MGDIKKYKGVTFVSLTSQRVSSIQNIKYIKNIIFKTKPPMHWEYCETDLALLPFQILERRLSRTFCLVFSVSLHRVAIFYVLCNKFFSLFRRLGCKWVWDAPSIGLITLGLISISITL